LFYHSIIRLHKFNHSKFFIVHESWSLFNFTGHTKNHRYPIFHVPSIYFMGCKAFYDQIFQIVWGCLSDRNKWVVSHKNSIIVEKIFQINVKISIQSED
jgi:hypothetical protein